MNTRVALCGLLLMFFCAAGMVLPQQESSKAARADSVASASRTDSILARTDSALILKEALSAEDYLRRREHYSYPRTRQQDPFNFPFSRTGEKESLGPSLDQLELTGVLYSPDGRSIAIMSTVSEGGEAGGSGGGSFLLHEGDILGLAEVILIEPHAIKFRIKEYGQVREIIKELKPLSEEQDAQSP